MSSTTHIRFRGDKKDTWAVSALNQIGPDDQAEIVYRTTQASPLFTTLDAINGDDGVLTLPYEQGIDNSLIGKKVYSHYYDKYVDILDVSMPFNVDQLIFVDITISAVLDYTDKAIGTLVEIYNDEYVYVSKSGNDANTGTPASPKLTIQAAIDAAVAAGATHVQVLDSGVYEERLDLKGVTVEAAPGQTPTIRYPITGWTGSGTLGGSVVNGLAEFVISCQPLCIAATSGGLYTSVDGRAWTLSYLNGKDLRGCVVWDDSTGDALYVANYTDGVINKVSLAGSVTTYATGQTISKLSGAKPTRVLVFHYGLYVQYEYNLDYYGSAIFTDGVWIRSQSANFVADETVGRIFKAVIAGKTVSVQGYSFGGPRLCVYSTGDYPLAVSSDLNYPNAGGYNSQPIEPLDIALFGTTPVAIDSQFLYSLPNIENDPTNWQRVGVHGVVSPSALVADPRGWLYVLGSGGNHSISRDGGRTWYTYGTAPAAKAEYAPAIFFRGVWIVAKSTDIAYEDKVHIRDSGENCTISGCVLDGQDMAVYAYAGTVSFRNCRVRRHYQPCEDIAVSVSHRETRFEDMKDSSFRGSSVINCIIDRCEFARFTGAAVRITGPGVSVEECTIAASGRGLRLEAVPKSVSGCIISGNTVDIDSAVSGAVIEDTCFETRAGLPLTETGCIIGNPLFVDDSGANLTLKSRALGYAADSALLDDVDSGSGVDMRESIGARRYSRVLSSSEYGLDYTLHCNPGTVRNAYRPANYDKAYSQNGSMYGRETNPSAHKLARTLSWDSTGGEDAKTKAQAAMLRYIYGLDSVLDVGDSTDGTDFVPRRTGSKVSTFNRVSFGATDPLIAPNEHAGAWCIDESGTIIGRIDSHTASYLSSGVYVIDITWQSGTDLPTATSVCKIDAFRRFRIDKTQPFSPVCQMPYVPGIISDIPTQYDITLEEVDE